MCYHWVKIIFEDHQAHTMYCFKLTAAADSLSMTRALNRRFTRVTNGPPSLPVECKSLSKCHLVTGRYDRYVTLSPCHDKPPCHKNYQVSPSTSVFLLRSSFFTPEPNVNCRGAYSCLFWWLRWFCYFPWWTKLPLCAIQSWRKTYNKSVRSRRT